LHIAGILFPLISDDALSKSRQIRINISIPVSLGL